MDWEKIGLKMGLEIHQQLDTKHKLFCPCGSNLLDKDPEYNMIRNLRPTQSELGTMDRASFAEVKRKLYFIYEGYDLDTCLVEADEEPPWPLNEEALKLSMVISLLLNMQIVDEVHTMRKQVIDGSNTGGFQRTSLIATDGCLETKSGKVTIENLCLEEDSCKRIQDVENASVFRLDRLGIPLVEITTDPSINDPEQMREVAYQIGQVLRSTNVKRGLGTVRQDVNISIHDGARVELKGVQDLDLIPEIVKREVQRQQKLIELRDELKDRNAVVCDEIVDLSDVFKDTESRIILRADSVLGVKLKGFDGLIGVEVQPGSRLGTEFSGYAKKVGVSGIIHTDELPGYNITENEVLGLRKAMSAEPEDSVVLVASDRDVAYTALEEVKNRANMVLSGVPEETRKMLEDGNSEYMRPLPTANRMYVETDIPKFVINREEIKELGDDLPELPNVKKERMIKEYCLSEDLVSQLVRQRTAEDFEYIMSNVNVDKTVVASLFAYSLKELKREGYKIDDLSLDNIVEIFKLLEDNKISKDSVIEIVKCVVDENIPAINAAENLDLILMSEDDVKNIVSSIVDENKDMVEERGMDAMGPLMGIIMKKLKGKADGKVINILIKECIQNIYN